MKTAGAVIIKFVVTLIASWISFFYFDHVLLTIVVVIAGLSTILNYLTGDIFFLPRIGNGAAAIIDGFLAAITAYLVLIATNHNVTASISTFAVMIAVSEFFFHMYLFKSDTIKKKETVSMSDRKKLNFKTETAKEIHPYGDIWKPSNRSDDKEY